ncbi:unnamed protein product [Haemonchus placei]|uniref:Alpha/beta hydrolase fold-3 domain-containing protein n=1 Tax=Haemonchus placei TaxID=6290 RepID=A0A3P7WG84_HAEPC|nr:unnamed protein product [Haemonchus placei]
MAAVVSQRLAGRNENFIKCQILIYPVIHVFAFQLPSYLAYCDRYNGTSLLNPRAMARWILLYLGLPAHKKNVELEKKPRKAEDEDLLQMFSIKGANPDVSSLLGVTKDLPPAFVLTAEYDILRDEGIQYAEKLQKEGVPCKWKHYKSAYHGVCNMPYSLVRRNITRDICDFLKNFI